MSYICSYQLRFPCGGYCSPSDLDLTHGQYIALGRAHRECGVVVVDGLDLRVVELVLASLNMAEA